MRRNTFLFQPLFVLLVTIAALLDTHPVAAQTPQVLKDIYGTTTLHSTSTSGYSFFSANGILYFAADDGVHGNELWKTDGTEAGTMMVKDLNAGIAVSNPQQFVVFNGQLYFNAQGTGVGSELWRTDGTEAGTVLVKDIVTGATGSSPQNMTVINGTLYFTAQTSANGRELWKTDGTDAGTVLVKDINAGAASSGPQNLVNLNGLLLFTATTSANGLEYWKSDGTAAGTVLLKDINPGSTNTTFITPMIAGNLLFFTAFDPTNGYELWRTDGTDAGTFILDVVYPGTNSSGASIQAAVGNNIFFIANNPDSGTELWTSDGTEAGTVILNDINPGTVNSTPGNLMVIGNTIYFTATNSTIGLELWKTDGTPAGTVLVKDINPGINSSGPTSLVNVNGTLFFSAITTSAGRELWKSDGTETGTVEVKDLVSGTGSSSPFNLTNVNGVLFFTAVLASQTTLFKTDGTNAGTVSLNSAVLSGGSFVTPYAHGGKLYFMHDGLKAGVPSTATGREPWVSDGTDAGTGLLKDINTTTAESNPASFYRMGNNVFFSATDGVNGVELWKTDGTEAGTVLVKDISPGAASSAPGSFMAIGNTLYFAAGNTATGRELWKTDGTAAGTVLVKDMVAGASGGTPTLLTDVNGVLFFTNSNPRSIWKSDGTDAGTVMVANLATGSSGVIQDLVAANGLLFFTAQFSTSGRELWKSDGTAAGTVMVKDINPGTATSDPQLLTSYNGKVYFGANDGTNGREPWMSDGTEAGTTMLVNIATSGSFPNSNPNYFKVAGGKLYFTAFTANTSFEPYVSDGTPAGTYMITEINPGGSGSTPFNFTEMNGLVYFNASSSGMGRELWRTDNTAIGTELVKDIYTGTGDSYPDNLTVVNNTLFFIATTPEGGLELFKSDGTEAGTTGFDLNPGTIASTPAELTALNDMLIFTASHPIYGREIWKATAVPAPSNSFSIAGDTTTCVGNTVIYTAQNVVGNDITYHWSLPDGGGTLSANGNTATVTWTIQGNYKIALYLSNSAGATPPKEKNITVNTGGAAPTQAPVISEFARTLSASNFPNGAYCQWYRNGFAIPGAQQPYYYAAQDGIYTARFVSQCATGPESNAITFATAAISQTITFTDVPDITLTPTAKVKLDAMSTSGLPVFFQKILGPGVIQNDTLYVTGSGTLATDIVIRAIQPGNEIYSPANDVQQTIRVIKGNQVINFDSIPDMILGPQLYQLTASSSVGLPVTYSVVSGNALVSIQSGNKIKFLGAGSVTIRASQIGNTNYFGATPVDRTFCIGVRTISAIAGDVTPCLNTYRYNAQKIPGANYVWTLSGGGTLTTHNDTAWVAWQTPGNHTLKVKVNSPCDVEFSEESILEITTSANAPAPVTGMIPVNGADDQQLPLRLSWIPGANSTLFDVYIWKATDPQPATPYIANIEAIFVVLPANSFQYNTTYKWRIVSKNPCSQTDGPIQEFSIIPLPDLQVSDVQAPASATSGQTISVSWKVTNVGPGATLPDATWYDGVYFALDTVPHISFNGSPNWNPSSWNSLTANGRPLLLGKKIRPSSLASGESYTNTIDFTLPVSYSFPVYIYVITDNEHPNWKILQVSVANDTARKQTPMEINLAPTPDLRVDSVFTPAVTFSGSEINLTYKVSNYGVVTPTGANWTDSVFISQNPLFDRSLAIPLKAIKTNGTYYPNAPAATVYNSTTQLQPGESYTRSLQVVVPNFIFGSWFVYVKTNAGDAANTFVYEGSFDDNNIGQALMQVNLTPTPKLTIQSLNVPVTNASTTQTVGINWNIKNEGFRDNLQKNKGHYITMGSCSVACASGAPNTVCYTTSVVKDSVTYGGSYWVDRIYLSTDPNGLNVANAILIKEVNHGSETSGLYTEAGPPTYSFVSCPAKVSGNVNVDNVINPGSSFPKSEGFAIPSNLAPGNYYVYVYTNPTKTVFEYPGIAQIRRSDLPITVQRPDLTVSLITTPAVATGGQPISIQYTVANVGGGSVYNHIRRDRIYISNFSTFDGNAQLIGTNTFTEDILSGATVPHTFIYDLPAATAGIKYFYVITNYDSTFKETAYVNNLSTYAFTSVTAAVPADLVVNSVQTADSVFTVFSSKIIYTVTNNGSGVANGSWTDSVFISCNPVYNRATSYYIGQRTKQRVIAPSTSYTDTLTVNLKYAFEINLCFPESMYGHAYFYVKVNADTNTYEGSAVNNNVGGTGQRVIVNPLVDHIVTTVNGPDATSVGAVYNMDWRIRNIGYDPGQQYYSSWYDAVYFSADSTADDGDIKAYEQYKYLRIDRNQDTGFTRAFYTPNMVSGDYYVFVHNNPTNHIPGEKNLVNNINFIRDNLGAAKKIHVLQPPLADLVDSIVSAPTSVAAGQPLTLIYKITNKGIGTSFPGSNWQNRILLSTDLFVVPNDGDRLLSTRYRTSVLPANQFYFDTVTVTIPATTIPGNYVLISEANSNDVVIESNLNNNLGLSLITVYTPPVSDLTVSGMLMPDTVTLGYTIDTAKWVVTNISGEQARGHSKDGIYLSAGGFFDTTAVLIGVQDKYLQMQPLQADTVRMAPLVTDVVEGNYNVFVKTDLINNIPEENKDNNLGISTKKVFVKARELKMNIEELNTLSKIQRYYKLVIPDSLLGSTIMVTLTTPDSLSKLNELFISAGKTPTAAIYDYRYEKPNYGNQRIIMTDVTDSVYYIMYRCVSVNPGIQNVKLKAVKLPFAILEVHSNAGGNIGNVTVRIRGSLFAPGMTARLRNGNATITASAIYYTNSSQVYATFPLQGKPLGIYDVILTKADLSEAVLESGFSIVNANNGGLITGGGVNTGAGDGNEPGCDPGAASGLNSQLSIELVVPSRVLAKRPVVILVNYSNPTNFDLPVQSRILYSEDGVKMAFTKEGVPTGTTALYLEFTEPGGPPGIIRAGGSGTITIHAKAPDSVPADGAVLFKLK